LNEEIVTALLKTLAALRVHASNGVDDPSHLGSFGEIATLMLL
jgi:hypothetical protein